MVQGLMEQLAASIIAVYKWVLLGNQAIHLRMIQRVRKDKLFSPRYFTPMDLV